MCLEVVTALKEKYPHIKRIYVRSAFPDISDRYEKYLLKQYEETYFPEKVRKANRASYVVRNKEMIDKSEYCVCYYDEQYLLSKSGTRIAYKYAIAKKRNW